MGNALGLIRLVRHGAMKFCCNALQFAPGAEMGFALVSEPVSDLSSQAVHQLDDVINTLQTHALAGAGEHYQQ